MVGIDEAGRGTLAGSLFVAACKFTQSTEQKLIDELKDSKKLSEKKRFELALKLKKQSKFLILAFSNEMIDKLGLSTCITRALQTIKKHFKDKEFLFDGNTNFKVSGIKTLIKADDKIPEVSAASILAKTSKDEEMINFSKIYPHYAFEKHKGYASKAHLEAILKFGVCKIHRKSFKIKSLEKEKSLFDQ